MSDWRDVMEARRAADDAASAAVGDEWTVEGERIFSALLAVRLELRALGTLIDHARGDAR